MSLHYTRECDRCKRTFTDNTMKPLCAQCAEAAPMAQACGGSKLPDAKLVEPSYEFERAIKGLIVEEIVRSLVETEFAKPEVMARLNAAVMDVVNKPPTGGVVPPLRKVPLEFVGDPQSRPSMQAEQMFGVCRACEAKDRELADARAELGRERDEFRACSIESSEKIEELQREKFSRIAEVDKWRKEHARLEQLLMAHGLHPSQPAQPAAPDPRPRFSAGDTVRHGPSGEEWVLACDEVDGCVCPAGWPETIAAASDCKIVKRATAAERLSMLEQVAKSSDASVRSSHARKQLRAEGRWETAAAQPAQWSVIAASADAAAVLPRVGPDAVLRRRFLAGDLVTFRSGVEENVPEPFAGRKFRLPLDEQDDGSCTGFVAYDVFSGRTLRAADLELVDPATRAQRHRELAFQFHIWNTDVGSDVMDAVPDFVRIAAQQLLRDPWEKPSDPGQYGYGMVQVKP